MSLKGYKIFIDAGHGGSDAGAVNNNKGLKEKDLTLDIAKRLNTRLIALGATTQMSRTTDVYPTLEARAIASNNFKANIFISVHINAGGGTGVETWVHDNATSNTNKLAQAVSQAMASRLSATNRGVKKAPSQRTGGQNIYVIDPKNNKAWAILPEVLFIDNATDIAKLQSSTYLQAAAESIATGVSNFVATLPPIN
ncbi:MAG: N-acetylmuramoyl-L-alanine amidase [Kurthia sp.]|nr:N-acetylmuramoyl-L-alanine amidase [Candidatus Kurthia equi]